MKDESISSLKSVIIVLFLMMQAMIASSPMLHDGWFLSHDVTWHLDRLIAVIHEIDQGDYYPRWLSTGAFGKGLPILNYYSPGVYLVAGYFHVLGIPLILVLKIICFSLFFLGSVGMFLWVKPHHGLFGALIAATIYTFVPYHFVDIYVRGAIPEFAAMALLPFLFHSIDRIFSDDKYLSGVILTGTFTALIILTHNLSAFMILPFAFVYFIWCEYSTKQPLRRILLGALGPLLGIGLSSFYWLPLLTEIDYLAHFKKYILNYSYSDYFINPSDWFSTRWGFGYALPRSDAMSFQVGYVLLLFVIVSILAAISMRGKERNFGFITLALGLIGLFFTTSAFSDIYKHFSLLQYVQFPWRFLGIATLFFTAFTGLSVSFKPISRISYGPIILLCFAFVLSILISQEHRGVSERITGDIEHIGQIRIDTKSIGMMAAKNEYLPKWSKESVVPLKFDEILVPEFSKLKVEDIEIKDSKMRFYTESEAEADLIVRSFYFPGWKATIDDKYKPLSHTAEGFIVLRVPPGRHTVQLWFDTTWPRIVGWLISMVTLLTLSFLVIKKKILTSRTDV